MSIVKDKPNNTAGSVVAGETNPTVVGRHKNSSDARRKSSSAKVGRGKKTLWVVLLMLTGVIAALCYTLYFDYAKWPYAIEYEGHVLWACVNLAQGHNVYSAASLVQQPYAVIMYNPLFLVIGAGLVKIFGVSFVPLRAISILSTLLLFPTFFVLLKRCRLSDFHALIGVAFLATSMPVIYWSNLARVDMLGLALGVFGLERFIAGWNKRGSIVRSRSITGSSSDAGSSSSARLDSSVAPLLFSSVLFILAFFTKQQYFVFPAAATIFCILNGSAKLGFKHLATWLAPVLAIGIAIEVLSGGGYLAHLRYGSGLPWEIQTLTLFMTPFVADPKVLVGTAILIAFGFASGRVRPFYRLAVILMAISLPLALYTMGLRAAFHNHLLCVYVALCWLVALSLPRLTPKYTTWALIGLLLGNYWAFGTCLVFISERLSLARETQTAMAGLAKLNLKGKMILSEDPSIALALGATTDLVDSTTIFNICRSKPNGLKPFVDNILSEQYPVIILNGTDVDTKHERIWPKPLIEALLAKYRLAGTMAGNGNPQQIYLLKTDRRIIE
jgi:hypothetical protein